MSEFLHMMLSLGSSSPLGMWNCFPAHPSQFHAGWTLPLQAGGGSTGGEPVDGLGVPPGSHPGGPAPKEEFASIWKEKVAAAETATSTLHEHIILYIIYIYHRFIDEWTIEFLSFPDGDFRWLHLVSTWTLAISPKLATKSLINRWEVTASTPPRGTACVSLRVTYVESWAQALRSISKTQWTDVTVGSFKMIKLQTVTEKS